MVEIPLQIDHGRPNSPAVDSGKVPYFWAIEPTALVVRTGKRKLALTLTRSSRELMHALDALRGEEIVMLAERHHYIAKDSVRGLTCYLRHCRGLSVFKRKHGPVYHLSKYGWKALQAELSLRWCDVSAEPRADLHATPLLPFVADLLPEPAETLELVSEPAP